jgi:hypothetical protein
MKAETGARGPNGPAYQQAPRPPAGRLLADSLTVETFARVAP